jgi:DNA-binding LacI/PurR family transcriptional regulator
MERCTLILIWVRYFIVMLRAAEWPSPLRMFWYNDASIEQCWKRTMSQRVTLEDGARRSGVSPATVSLVLRAKPGINDDSAIELMRALQASGRRVPDAISLIGFDAIDLAAQVLPALTTMHIDTVGMGRLAVQLLRNRVEFPAAGLVTTVLQPTLIERQSVRTLSDS